MTRLFAFGVSPQLVAIGCIPTCRLLSAFVILKIVVLSSCFQSVRFGLDLQIVIFAASSVNRCINTDWMQLGRVQSQMVSVLLRLYHNLYEPKSH